MTALPLELRRKIVAACDMHEGTRAEIAGRFGVSLAMVKKLLGQRVRTGDLRSRLRYCGAKPRLIPAHGVALRELVAREPDLTLAQIRDRLGMACTVQAVHHVLGRLGLRRPRRA